MCSVLKNNYIDIRKLMLNYDDITLNYPNNYIYI